MSINILSRQKLNQSDLVYLYLFLIPTQLGLRYWPENALVLGLRIDYLSLIIYISDLLLLAILLLNRRYLIKNLKSFTNHPFSIVILYLLFQTTFILTFKIQSLLFLIKIMALIGFTSILKTIKYSRHKVSQIFSIQLLFIFILSFLQLVKQSSIQGFFYFLGERRFSLITPGIATAVINGQKYLRPYAFFSHPNIMSAYALLTGLYVLYFFTTHQVKEKIFKAFVLVLTFLILVISYSQNSWLALVISLTLILSPKIVNQCYQFLLPLTLLVSLSTPFLLIKLSPIYSRPEIISRNLIFQKLKQFSSKDLIWGTGLHDHLLINNQTYPRIQTMQPIHNSVWLALTLLGLAGTCLAIKPIKSFFHKAKSLPSPYRVILITAILLSSFDHFFLTAQPLTILLVFIMAEGLNYLHESKR